MLLLVVRDWLHRKYDVTGSIMIEAGNLDDKLKHVGHFA